MFISMLVFTNTPYSLFLLLFFSPYPLLSLSSSFLLNIPSNTLSVTGGIRCVKINAYLEQVLGFTNVSRLAGGIISYTRELEQEKEKSNQANDRNEITVSTNSDVDKNDNENENENDALTMISKPVGKGKTFRKEDSSSVGVDVKVEEENSPNEEIGIHLSRNLLGSKFKVPETV